MVNTVGTAIHGGRLYRHGVSMAGVDANESLNPRVRQVARGVTRAVGTAQGDLTELTARVQALSAQTERADNQRDEMTARWAWINPVLHAPYVRVLSLDITSERSTVRVQVATPEVLSEALTHELEMTAVRPLGFGYEVTLEAQHAR